LGFKSITAELVQQCWTVGAWLSSKTRPKWVQQSDGLKNLIFGHVFVEMAVGVDFLGSGMGFLVQLSMFYGKSCYITGQMRVINSIV
jgi:hypothetical protein